MINVPFISNTSDDLHCLQATYMMIVKYFMPNFDIDWQEWSIITGFEAGKGTWALSSILWLTNNNFIVKHVSLFDYETFVSKGGQYLKDEYGEEVGSWQIKHTNMPKEISLSKQLLINNLVEKREPTISEIKMLLDEGYLIHCLVNSNKLNQKQGYVGHAIVVYGHDKENLFIHDPGLPAVPSRKVNFNDFESSWASPNKQAKELTAVKLKTV